MAVSGVPERRIDHAERMIEFAIDMLRILREFNSEFGYDLRLRVGMNSGPVVAGVIGATRVQFDIWGDSVNVASRLILNHKEVMK